jgi:hypothetical protein
VPNVTLQSSSTVADGRVISQDPAAPATVSVGSTVDLVVSSGPVNVAPEVTNPGTQTVAEGSQLTVNIQATDPNAGQLLTYTLDSGPAGATLDPATGALRWSPADGPSTATISVRVTDDGTPTLSTTVTFDVNVSNVAPTLQISGQAATVPGETYTLNLSSSDPGVDTISQWRIDWGDSIEIVSGSATIIQHTYTAAGNYWISAEATDEDGTYSSNGLTVSANTPPILQNPGNRQSTLNVPLNLQIIASDADAGDTMSYAANGLPRGLSIDVATGLISGTPSKTGNYNVVLFVSDSRGATTSTTFSWSITRKSTAPAPTVSLSASAETIAFGESSILTWSSAGATSCVASDGWSGPRSLSGSEAVAPASTSTYVLTCTGDGGSTTRGVTISVQANSPPTFDNPPAAQSNRIGDVVNLAISATDSGDQELTFSATGLPAGLSISATSVNSASISGTLVAAGIWNVTVTVDDGVGGIATTSFTWTVSGSTNTAPTVLNPGDQSGVRRTSVSLQIQATDVDGDQLSYSATGLPAGLSINPTTGLISGVYASNGKTTATVTVQDGNGGVTSVSFRWSVSNR